jgi:DNA-binding transcriptional ArsR family regulator
LGQIINIKGKDFLDSSDAYLSSDYKTRIIELLKENKSGLTIAEIIKKTGTTRQTVSVVLAELRGAKLVEIRKIGVAKLHNWRDYNEIICK